MFRASLCPSSGNRLYRTASLFACNIGGMWRDELIRDKWVKLVMCVYIHIHIYTYVYIQVSQEEWTNFERVFLILNYTAITQNTYIQSWTVTEIMAREVWNFDSCYTLIDYQIHIKTGRNMWFFVMLISVLNIKVTCEWHKAIKLNYKSTRTTVVFVLRFPSNLHRTQLFVISPRSLHYDVS